MLIMSSLKEEGNKFFVEKEYEKALEQQLGMGALEKFDNEAQANMQNMNNYSKILYSKFKGDILNSK